MSDVLPKKVVSDVKRRIAFHSIVLLLWSHSSSVILNIASFQINFSTFIIIRCPDTQPVLSHAKPMWWHSEIYIKTDMSRVPPVQLPVKDEAMICVRREQLLARNRTDAGTFVVDGPFSILIVKLTIFQNVLLAERHLCHSTTPYYS